MENIQAITINNIKEFKELAKNKNIHEAYIEYKCQQCGRLHKIHKAYGKGTKSDNHYYRMLKWEDDHPLICSRCFSSNNFKETQSQKSKEDLQEEFAKRWETRKKNISTQVEEDSKVEYTSFEELEKAFNNGIKGATVICPDCGEKKVIKGRQNLYHFIKNGNINHNLRCRGCAISKGKKEENLKRLINDSNRLYKCHFKEGQEYKGADLEKRGYLRNKYIFVCDTCNQEFQDYFTANSVTMCPYCYPHQTTTSQYESYILDYVKSIYKGNIIRNDRRLISPYELDIYIPNLKLAVEFDGLYWHSFKSPDYHLNKTLMCEDLGIKLIHINSDDYFLRKDFIESILRDNIKKVRRIPDENTIYDRRFYSPLDFSKYEIINVTPPKHYFTDGEYLSDTETEKFNKNYFDCGTFMIKKI